MSENARNRLTSFKELGQLKNGGKSKMKIAKPLQSPELWIEDGVDHINVWDSATTRLGKFLAHSSDIPLKHPTLGKFASMFCFWHWVGSLERDDSIRTMTGNKAKRFIKQLTNNKITNFKAIIADAHWIRVKSNSNMMEEIKKSTLPYDCYYINRETKARFRPNFYSWILELHEEIRRAVKEGREPDFSTLMDKKNSNIYDFLNTNIEARKAEKLALINQNSMSLVIQGLPKDDEEDEFIETETIEIVKMPVADSINDSTEELVKIEA